MSPELMEVMAEEIDRFWPERLHRDWRDSADHVALMRDYKRGYKKCRPRQNARDKRKWLAGRQGRGLCKDCPGMVSTKPDGSKTVRCVACAKSHREAQKTRQSRSPEARS